MKANIITLGFLLSFSMAYGQWEVAEPDTTNWKSYFPLEVGNEWTYLITYDYWRDPFVPSDPYPSYGLLSWKIVGDTLIDGLTYYKMEEVVTSKYEGFVSDSLYYLGYDEIEKAIVSFDSANQQAKPWSFYPCSLDIPYSGRVDIRCSDDWGSRYGNSPHVVSMMFNNLYWVVEKVLYKQFVGPEYRFLGKWGLYSYRNETKEIRYEMATFKVEGVEYTNPLVNVNREEVSDIETQELFFYPNPVEKEGTLSIALSKPEQVEIKIIDVLGRVVYAQSVFLSAQVENIPISLPTSLARGMYIIIVQGQREKIYSEKVLVK